jgi:hypothetical protein
MGESECDDEAWQASAGHAPLREENVNQVFLLHRHWIWSNYWRMRFRATLPHAPKRDDGAFLADECCAS